jgi:hypothetical protein
MQDAIEHQDALTLDIDAPMLNIPDSPMIAPIQLFDIDDAPMLNIPDSPMIAPLQLFDIDDAPMLNIPNSPMIAPIQLFDIDDAPMLNIQPAVQPAAQPAAPEQINIVISLEQNDSGSMKGVTFVRNDTGNYVVNTWINGHPTEHTSATVTIEYLYATATVSISSAQHTLFNIAYKLTYNPWKDWLGPLSFLTKNRIERESYFIATSDGAHKSAQISNIKLSIRAIN